MMVMIHLNHTIAMTLAIVRNVLDTTTLARLAIANPATVGELIVAAGNVGQDRRIRLNRRRSRAKGNNHAKHDCPYPQARQ